jgi:transaldolase
LGPNVIAKIPATKSGLAAMERLVADNLPVLATEIMSLSQALATCETYKRVSSAAGVRPPFFITHITGIFDEYVQNYAKEKNVAIEPDVLWQAGTIVARHQYRVLRERGHDDIVTLGGGARGTHHFTEMVGSTMHVTINWEPTATDILAADPPVQHRMDCPSPQSLIDELTEKIPAFCTAMDENALAPNEYESFGPVQLFRSMFCDGWQALTEAIGSRRAETPGRPT